MILPTPLSGIELFPTDRHGDNLPITADQLFMSSFSGNEAEAPFDSREWFTQRPAVFQNVFITKIEAYNVRSRACMGNCVKICIF